MRSLDRKPFCSYCNCHTHFTRGCTARLKGVVEREDDTIVKALLCREWEQPDDQLDLLIKLWQ